MATPPPRDAGGRRRRSSVGSADGGTPGSEHPAGSVIDTLAGTTPPTLASGPSAAASRRPRVSSFDLAADDSDSDGGGGGGRFRGGASRMTTTTHTSTMRSSSRASGRTRRESDTAQVVELWKEAKAELHSKNRLISQLQARVQRTEAAMEARDRHLTSMDDMSQQQEELMDKLKFTELQMVNLKAENKQLKASYKESLAKLGESLKILEVKSAAERKATTTVSVLESKLEEEQQEKQAILSRSSLNLRTYEEQSLEKEKAMAAVNQRAAALQEALESVRQERVELLEQVSRLQADNSRLAHEADTASARLTSKAAEAKSLAEAAANEKARRAQVQHLRADNARLVRLLATTAEYATFAKFAFPEDAKSATGRARSAYLAPTDVALAEGYDQFLGGEADESFAATDPLGPTFLDASRAGAGAGAGAAAAPDTAAWDELEAYASHYSFPDTNPVSSEKEADMWVPADAVRLTANFRRKHLSHVPLPLIREFLLELNAVWRRRFNKQTARIKERYTAQIKELKRMLNQRVPYREVVQKSEIDRLQHDMKSLRRSRSRSRTRRRRSGTAVEMVDTGHERYGWCSRMQVKVKGSGSSSLKEAALLQKSLATVENLSRRVAEYAEENDELHKSLANLHDTTISKATATTTSMQAFNRGVNWLGRQVVRLGDKLGSQVGSLTEELQRHLSAAANTSDANLLQIRQQITAITNIQARTTEFRSQVRTLFEQALATGKSARRFEALFSDTHALDDTAAPSPASPRPAVSAEGEAWT